MQTNDDPLGIEARTILRDALLKLEAEHVRELIGDTTYCLDTGRVRDLTADASSVTVHEQRHVMTCARCNSRVRAFQSAKATTPQLLWEAILKESQRAPLPAKWAMYADEQAQQIFERLHREQGANLWPLTTIVADGLRDARARGAGDAISARLVAALLRPMVALSHNVLTPWSTDFDAAWPMFELLREAAKEAARAGDGTREQFVESYVRIAIGAPTLLRAVLVDGIDALDEREELTYALAHDASPETRVLFAAAAPPRLSPDLVAETLLSLFDILLVLDDGDPVAFLLQLRTIRHYLAEVVDATHGVTAERRQLLLSAATDALLTYVRDRRASVFLVMQACQALAEESLAYANVLSTMLRTKRSEMMDGAVVGLRRAYEASTPEGEKIPRFERHGGAWRFSGRRSHPMYETATDVAQLAKQHPRLVGMLEWFNHRLEPTVQNEPVRIS